MPQSNPANGLPLPLHLSPALSLKTGERVQLPPFAGSADALRIAADEALPLDLLVTDVVMPGMNGWELAQRLQARQPGLRALFITGYTPDAILQQGIALEPDLVLQKPFAQTALVARVQELLAAT